MADLGKKAQFYDVTPQISSTEQLQIAANYIIGFLRELRKKLGSSTAGKVHKNFTISNGLKKGSKANKDLMISTFFHPRWCPNLKNYSQNKLAQHETKTPNFLP